jgi:hypothetical protein
MLELFLLELWVRCLDKELRKRGSVLLCITGVGRSSFLRHKRMVPERLGITVDDDEAAKGDINSLLPDVTSFVGAVVMIAGGLVVGGGFISRALRPSAESEAFLNRERLNRAAVFADWGDPKILMAGEDWGPTVAADCGLRSAMGTEEAAVAAVAGAVG